MPPIAGPRQAGERCRDAKREVGIKQETKGAEGLNKGEDDEGCGSPMGWVTGERQLRSPLHRNVAF